MRRPTSRVMKRHRLAHDSEKRQKAAGEYRRGCRPFAETTGFPELGVPPECASRMKGNFQVRFLGGKGAARPLTHPVHHKPAFAVRC